MKYLIVILVLVVFGWIVLRGGSKKRPRAGPKAGRQSQPESMVACRHCGVHLPRRDAVEDASGVYCTEAHRLAGARSDT